MAFPLVVLLADASLLPPDPPPSLVAQAQDLSDPPQPDPPTASADHLSQPAPSAQELMDPDSPAMDLAVSAQALRLRSDLQTFNPNTEIFEAEGNVQMEFGRSVLTAERMTIDIPNRIAIATGTVQVQLGDQLIQGDRLEYDFGQETGVLEPAFGQINLGSLPTDVATSGLRNDLLNGPPQTEPDRFIRFQADRITFNVDTWQAENLRVTNDPFDPPELEIRSPQATAFLRPDGSSLITAQPGQLVFDQVLFLPIPVSFRLDQLSDQPPISVFFDDFDEEEIRRGLVIQPNFELLDDPNLSWVISPQFYPQRLLDEEDGLDDGYGLRTDLRVVQPSGQATHIFAELRGFVFDEFSERLRLQVEHTIPTGDGGVVTYSYNFRERFFSGLLGFQIVENRLGARYSSPVIPIGQSGIEFSYQVAADQIDALGQDPAVEDVAVAEQETDRLQLTRFQLGTALSRSFQLWDPLTAEAEAGTPILTAQASNDPPPFRFSPGPIEQGLWLNTGVSTSQSVYTNGDTQSYLAGSVGIDAVIGDFVADTLDYTNIQITYSNGFLSGASPFLFDRITTREQLVLGGLQQLYGPVRVGAETTVDLQSGRSVDTTYQLNYDRRTYGLSLRYNPVRETGALELRVDSFNWGDVGADVTDVRGGIER